MKAVLRKFVDDSLFDASAAMLEHLKIKFTPQTKVPISFLELYSGATSAPMSKALTDVYSKVANSHFIGTIDEESLKGVDSSFDLSRVIEGKYDTMLVFATELRPGSHLTRTELTTLTRGFNRMASSLPVILFIKNGNFLSLASCVRSEYKQEWRNGEKLGKVAILRDIDCSNPHRGHIDILESIGDKEYPTFDELYKHWLDVFSSELLTKKFYTELYNWYVWALSKDVNVTFPNNPNTEKDDRENIHIKLIRLITRMLFVWFIKQKGLIPDCIFEPKQLTSILLNFDAQSSTEGTYYNAILQNLFFATLNCAVIDEDGNPRRFAASKSGRDTRNLYRYKEMFKLTEQGILELFAKVPFLNGGLFECLDKPKDLYLNQNSDILYDGFSRNATKSPNGNFKYRAFIPNKLFFNDDEKQPGLINLFKRYNFTIEENTPLDVVISLDPELLGRVFENLLAAYNPETQESARKSTGSFYTPRPIVDYMVDEAIKSYLIGRGLDRVTEENLKILFKERLIPSDWTDSDRGIITDILKQVKILDPACGSGAFPMGCLLRIVDIIELLNEGNVDRYQLKLSIIENCVYGVDIQPIAMLICKLRFFISLICEQNDIDFNSPETNFGINTLPNLETKFVAANTLISADIRNYEEDWTNDEKLDRMKEELLSIRHAHFLAKGRAAKKRSEMQDNATRQQLLDYIVSHSQTPDFEKIALYERILQQLSDELEQYKVEIWVDKTRPVVQTLFGIEEHPESLFREDINKNKREELTARIKTVKAEIAKELRKGEITGFEAAVKQITEWNPYDQNSVSPFFDPEWMFCLKDKFDIVIGNPPYISTKGVKEEDKEKYEKEFGFSDDTYNLFTFKGLYLCKDGGTLTYITPKTFWTIQTKRNMRDLLLSNTIRYVFDTANPFKAAMVDTCITQTIKQPMVDGHTVKFYDGTVDLDHPVVFPPILQKVFINTQNSVIFKPTPLNLRIYELYGEKVKELYDKWWDKIETSKKISKYQKELEAYRASLRPGDVALLGCLTEGGQGLATANNGKYIAVRRSTKLAKNIIESRPKKLAEAIKKMKIKVDGLDAYATVKEFLASLSEKEIASLFDNLKEKYGRDIFGQGYIYKVIDDCEMANVDQLTKEEKENGIDSSKNFYVPYDKGDKDGNRWYLETPFAIAWSKENVQFLKTDPKARYQGYTFFFREGFCWIDVNSTYLKARVKANGVFDVLSMSLFTMTKIPDWYFVGLINSELISLYVDNFVNNTSHFQINDARQLPIIIPDSTILDKMEMICKEAISFKERSSSSAIDNKTVEEKLLALQQELDDIVRNYLYGI